MKPWETLGTAQTPEGATLTLARRGDEYVLRVGGHVLMSSRQHGSEEALAEACLAGLAAAPAGGRSGGAGALRVLVGGLGFGYTARAALGHLGPSARLTVAELSPAVVAWNRGVLAPLAGAPLEDPRVEVVEGDVQRVLSRSAGRFDAVLLDVDNGPSALTQEANAGLYGLTGLGLAAAALRPGGRLGVWSAGDDAAFTRRLRQVGLEVDVLHPAARGGTARGARHTLFIGRRPR
jgi:spermidine synthase